MLVGRIDLPKDPVLSGLSGIEVSADGTALTAVSDRGWFVVGTIARDRERPVALRSYRRVSVLDEDGQPMRENARDAEGLALGRDGWFHVSFELWHRVRAWRLDEPVAWWFPDLPRDMRFPANRGLEALAIGPDDTLYALPEQGGGPDELPVYTYAERRWRQPFALPRRGEFQPVGADFGPDGRFYLLERQLSFPLGFRSRVRRFTFGPDGPVDEITLLETRVGTHGNLEGISVWRDSGGAIRLTMVADDNGLALQRNELVEYRVVSLEGEG